MPHERTRSRVNPWAALSALILTLFLAGRLDAGSLQIRALHVPLVGSEHKDYLLSVIDRAAGKFNMLIIQVNNKVRYDGHPELTTKEGKGSDTPMSKQDVRFIVDYAKKKGMEAVPEVKFLTHQEKLLRNTHPELMLNSVTYNPRDPRVYKIVFSLIDEIAEVFHPRYFLIGHDENRKSENKKADSDDTSALPTYQEFAGDANMIADYLKKKGITPMMWGDMLLNPDSFTARAKNDFNGKALDYYKAADLLDKGIVIIDWHYWWIGNTFPTVNYFLSKGFDVLGSTWKDEKTINNFSAYMKQQNNPHVLGMVATTWFHVDKKDDEVLNRIITVSARAFNN